MSPKPLLVLLAFLSVASPCHGERTCYHVIGSYAELSNAMQVQARIAGQLSVEVMIVPSRNGHFNRLLVRADEVATSTLDDAGIPHWLLILDKPVETPPLSDSLAAPEPAMPPPEPVAPDIQPVPEPEPEPAPEPTPSEPALPEIREDESLTVYCRRVAVPLCQTPMARWVIEKEARLQEGKAALRQTCRATDDPAVATICGDFFE